MSSHIQDEDVSSTLNGSVLQPTINAFIHTFLLAPEASIGYGKVLQLPPVGKQPTCFFLSFFFFLKQHILSSVTGSNVKQYIHWRFGSIYDSSPVAIPSYATAHPANVK